MTPIDDDISTQSVMQARRPAGKKRTRPALVRVFDPVESRGVFEPHPLGAMTVVGRAAPAGHIKLGAVVGASRSHAYLERRDDNVTLENQSKNGTFVNGERIDADAGKVPLNDGAVVRCGTEIFVFVSDASDVGDAKGASGAPAGNLIGESPAAQKLRALLHRVGKSDASVLLLGETGAGKEVCAHALHVLSGRNGAFVPVNCAAIVEHLAESALFGHKKGAFTGATNEADGFFQKADHGTLFLDEFGELGAPLQAKLLRVLDDGVVTKVGSTEGKRVDVRIVAATNRDIEADIDDGAFRSDLYARINDIVIPLPTLRARRADIGLLLHVFLGKEARFDPALFEALLLHAWPRNVRELKKVCKELAVRGDEQGVFVLDAVAHRLRPMFPPGAPPALPVQPPADDAQAPAASERSPPKKTPPRRDEIEAVLKSYRGNVQRVADHFGRSRKQVYRWLERYDLDAKTFRDADD